MFLVAAECGFKTLTREMGNLTEGSEKFDAKLKVLKESVEHHIEEEHEMFPKVGQFFGESELEQLGQEMEAAKREYGRQQRSTSSGSRK